MQDNRPILIRRVDVTVDAIGVQIFGPNLKRVGLILSSHTLNHMTVDFCESANITAGLGIRIWAKGPPVILEPDLVCDGIKGAISAVFDAGSALVSFYELFQ